MAIRSAKWPFLGVLAGIMVLCLLFCVLPSRVDAAINQQINFQGKLTNPDGTNVSNGTYSVVFSIYTVASGGSAVWTETQGSVSVTDGIFQVALGSVTALPGSVDFNSNSLHLGIKVGSDAEMTPRIQLTAAPYAFNASNLNGLASSAFAQLAQNQTYTGTNNFQPSTNSTTALQVQNSGGSYVLAVDTTTPIASNLITTLTASGTPSFEATSTTGWSGQGGCTLSAVTSSTSSPAGSIPYIGDYAGQCSNTATAGAQFRYVTGALTASTVYTFNFYAKVSATAGSVLNFGHRENGGAEDVAGLSLTSQTVGTSGWTRYSLTFKTGATLAAGDYLYIKQNDATARTLWIDGVSLQTDANADGNYAEGALALTGVIKSALILQNAANSTTAFQVANASGAAIFTVDSTDSNLVANPGAEVNANGWSTKGAAVAPIRDTSQQKYGQASFKTVTTAALNDGAQYTFASSLPVGTYSIGVSVKISGTTFGAGNLVAGLTNGGGDNNCVLVPAVSATIPSTTGWTRFSCNVTIATTAATAFYIKQTEAVVHTIWFDGIELDSGPTASPYGLGGVAINGVVTSPLTIRNSSDSTTALLIQNASSVSLLSVDSHNKSVQVGSNITDTNQVLFQPDSFSTYADTSTCAAATNQGAMYYNTTSGSMRACLNGTWEDMVSTQGLGLLMFGVVPDSANATSPGDMAGVTGLANGPCSVTWSATQQVTVNPCVAYSGGRKVIVASTALSTSAIAANAFVNICLTGTNSQPALFGTANVTETSASLPTFSINNPILCLATVKMTATAGNVGNIYDARTFTTTLKEFITLNSVNSVGFLIVGTNTGTNRVLTTTTANSGPIRGVVVATTGTASTNTINGIIAVSGYQYVKVIAAGSVALNGVLQTSTTAGYGRSGTTFATSYSSGGIINKTSDTTCTAATNCQFSALIDMSISR